MSKKLVCITGGYGKLGISFGKAFANAGWEVLITGRNTTKLKKSAREYGWLSFPLDVTNENESRALASYIESKQSKLDVLINNAAAFNSGAVKDLKPEQFLETITTNIYGPFLLTHILYPLLLKAENPIIFNVSSTSGHRADANTSAYNASKFGLMGFSEALRKEARRDNIRVTTLSPSSINFADDALETGKGARLHGDDIAEIAVFLAEAKGRALFRDIEIWATNP
ncbi:SDR family oxidoreductase [bacterium]|nr:SDR family oxidoreductase [bacterium]